MIGHPPCTDLAVSGARHFAAKKADGRQDAALEFVQALMDAPRCKVCHEVHWPRDPHRLKGEIKVEPTRAVAWPAPKRAAPALCQDCAGYRDTIARLRDELERNRVDTTELTDLRLRVHNLSTSVDAVSTQLSTADAKRKAYKREWMAKQRALKAGKA